MSLHRTVLAIVTILALCAAGAHTAMAQDSTKQEVSSKQLQSAASVREQIRATGMTPEQIRGRLRARGLSESILDAYMGGAAGGSGDPSLAPGRDVLAAVAVLGQADQRELDAATRKPVATDSVIVPRTIDGIPVFGMRIFERGTNQFEPNLAGPVDASYRLGPLDVVTVIATGQVELSHSLEVTRNGYIIVPQVGQIYVANLTLGEATRAIVQGMSRVYEGAGTGAGASTRVSVNVARLRTNQIFVIGDVAAPGSYQVSAAGTALSALYAAGGPTVNGSMRRIEVRRGGVAINTFDLYDYLLRGDASKDVRLENGDILFIPPALRRAAALGEVTRPAMYELKEGETLADLLTYAGGYTPTAARLRVTISRVLPPTERAIGGRDRVVIDVQGPELLNGTAPRTALQNGDRVTVYGITSPVRDLISVRGSVWAPGDQAVRPGMRLSDAIKKAGGAKGETYLDEVQVSRLLPDLRREQLRARLLDTLGNVSPDIVLQEGDQILLFSKAEFRTTKMATIGGKIRRPGSFDFTTGMVFRDLILLGGGVEEGTDLMDSVSVARLQPDLTVRTFLIPLRERTGEFASFAVAAGDSFVVHSRSEFRPARYITIGGAVNASVGSSQPGASVNDRGAASAVLRLPYTEGMTLRQAILAAGGLTERAWLPEVEISRIATERTAGQLATVFRVPLDSSYIFERGADGKYLGPPGVAARQGTAPEVPLQPYDHVNVLEQPEWSIPGSVSIGGEVRFPGNYAIRSRDERITDLIQRAGGLTERAYVDGAVFRRQVSPSEAQERSRLIDRVVLDRTYAMAVERVTAPNQLATETPASRTATNAGEAALKEALHAGLSEAKDRIAIDLGQALRRSTRDNFVVRAGDELFIPVLTPTVTVRGFVNAPVTLPYRPGATIDEYIGGAGGVTQNADRGGAFVQQPNGRIETYHRHRFRPDEVPVPRPGAVIVVPPKEIQASSGLSQWALVISALGTLTTAAAAIISLTR